MVLRRVRAALFLDALALPHALGQHRLLEDIRLASHRGLVATHREALQHHPVRRDLVAALDHHDVAHETLGQPHRLRDAVSEDLDHFLLLGLVVQFLELPLFLEIVQRVDERTGEHRCQNRDALDPGSPPPVRLHDHLDDDRPHGGHQQDYVHQVLHRVEHQLEEV